MILRIDDTDIERNTEQSLDSIFEGLKWLGLPWDEQYRQSDRLPLHKEVAEAILAKGMAYRDFTPLDPDDPTKPHGPWLFNPGQREIPREESDRRAAAGEPFAIRFRVPRETSDCVTVKDLVFGEQTKAAADIEDFALLRSNGVPTYHLASCADDIDLRITHIVRGQEHLANTFKHLLIFEAAGYAAPQFAHLPLLIAPDGGKLSKRKHGAVVSVVTYRDAGFLPEGFINFLCLLGWAPGNDREQMSLDELIQAFSFEGVHRSNALVNFTEADPFDPKAVMAEHAEHIRTLPVEALRRKGCSRSFSQPVIPSSRRKWRKSRRSSASASAFSMMSSRPLTSSSPTNSRPIPQAGADPEKADASLALKVLEKAADVLAQADFTHDGLESALRSAAESLGIKAGQMFEPVRVAVCGRKTAPPLFGTLEVLGPPACLTRIGRAIENLNNAKLKLI